ncbi:MAG TPA: hypothetical protein VGC76_14770 [Pyrinomonadaceae bacterium]|jgi:hypothetical protein
MYKAFGNAFKQFSFLLVLAFLLTLTISAQSVITGTWKADTKTNWDKKSKSDNDDDWDTSDKADNADKIYLSFERRTEKGGRNQNGSDYNYADLQGLSKQQAASGGAVKFSLVREAGTIDCEGTFADGKGSGTFRFTPNMQFVSGMKSRGFDFEKNPSRGDGTSEDRLFAAATINVTTALADDLLSANFGPLDVDDLFKAAIFKVDSKFMREMKASGFPNLGMEELVKARIFKIDADFVREVTQMGFDKEPFESLVKMRIFKVTPAFINEVKAEGLENLDIEDLVKMRIFKIDAAFIRQARAEGVPLKVEALVQKRIGVWSKD